VIWGAKNIAKLIALAAEGLSYTQIGKALGITKNAAIGKARRLKIDKSPALPTNTKAKPPAHKPQPKPIKPPPPSPAPVQDMKLLTMMELRDNHCRYPINGKDEMLFCGRHQDGKEPYCKQHAKICYVEPKIKPRSERRF
jgi:hypothetical protein